MFDKDPDKLLEVSRKYVNSKMRYLREADKEDAIQNIAMRILVSPDLDPQRSKMTEEAYAWWIAKSEECHMAHKASAKKRAVIPLSLDALCEGDSGELALSDILGVCDNYDALDYETFAAIARKARVPERAIEYIILRAHGYSYVDIALKYGVSKSAVNSLLTRYLPAMRKAMRDND